MMRVCWKNKNDLVQLALNSLSDLDPYSKIIVNETRDL